ncbi:hypothetical protein B0T18DRAFT_187047 [Schizothecium vesticola]|uniref:Uncharacterized protein n=1 Tax=Schizothecium vesticola TaxID=314040 RepID=A0AA40EQE7_9PEZI|nr:hypothetical protein B0T18DRAFT_187047 [Schizothecium vesticola]
MVGGRRVLLSIAALALDTALGGPLRYRDDGASGNSSPVSAGIQQQPDTPTSIPTRTTRLPPGPPPRSTAQLMVTKEVETFWLTAAPTTTHTSKEGGEDPYPYPGQWGAADELYTNEEAPTRSADTSAPTRSPPAVAGTTTEIPPLATGPSRTVAAPPSPETPLLPTAAAVTTSPPRLPPTRPTFSPVTYVTSESFDLGTGPVQPLTSGGTHVYYPPFETGMPTPEKPTEPEVTKGSSKTMTATPCQPSDEYMPKTIYSIIYTSTVTWYGQPADYTPLYPPITLPEPSCVTVPVEETPTPEPMARYSIISTTWCTSTGVGTRFRTCIPTVTTTWLYSTKQPAETSPEPEMMNPAGLQRPMPSASPVIILTTDKNPVVIFTAEKPPDYGVTAGPVTRDPHAPVTGNNVPAISTPVYDSPGPTTPQQQQQPSDPVTVVVRPTGVVINGNTFTDAPAAPTQTVVVSGVSFTIDPTRVVGGGATITRTATAPPTSTVLGGLQVVVSSSVAVVGGSTFSLENTPRTAVVSGQTVRIDATAVVVGGQTLAVPTVATPTEVVVAGGDLITVIGQSVLVVKSTTITYGRTGTSTTVVDDDTITFGPGGVTVHGTTLGGPSAKAGVTDFAVVGGATITRIGADVVVVGNTTFTVGPGMPTTTITFGGETITLSPRGVSVSTLDLPWPFGPTYTITPGATMTPNAAPTGGGSAEKDGAAGLRPDVPAAVTLICLAMGILFLGI